MYILHQLNLQHLFSTDIIYWFIVLAIFLNWVTELTANILKQINRIRKEVDKLTKVNDKTRASIGTEEDENKQNHN
ncbi:hypothetical protein ACE1CI_00425 [Aerosakkonemataceae cyanobacterium BLCC-F50]|uniref:Uncharacterized protein n=1 Tax=Floridaenema flaviceps BLCC-F50 TaxID=3153642 RepID=A0ABV4XI60_9CYAN